MVWLRRSSQDALFACRALCSAASLTPAPVERPHAYHSAYASQETTLSAYASTFLTPAPTEWWPADYALEVGESEGEEEAVPDT